jgi:hypothetical protein
MTHTPWIIEDCTEELVLTREDITYGIASCYCSPMNDETRANAAAILSAINNTYGCGVNPEAVPDLLEALKFVRDAPQFKRMDWKLKVTIDAAIAKAKLI